MIGSFEQDTGGVEGDRTARNRIRDSQQAGVRDLPDHALVLLLSDVSRHLAVHLT